MGRGNENVRGKRKGERLNGKELRGHLINYLALWVGSIKQLTETRQCLIS